MTLSQTILTLDAFRHEQTLPADGCARGVTVIWRHPDGFSMRGTLVDDSLRVAVGGFLPDVRDGAVVLARRWTREIIDLADRRIASWYERLAANPTSDEADALLDAVRAHLTRSPAPRFAAGDEDALRDFLRAAATLAGRKLYLFAGSPLVAPLVEMQTDRGGAVFPEIDDVVLAFDPSGTRALRADGRDLLRWPFQWGARPETSGHARLAAIEAIRRIAVEVARIEPDQTAALIERVTLAGGDRP